MSDSRLVERNVHRVDVDGRRMLFHIPTSGLFELDSLSDEMIDLFAPVAAMVARGEAPLGIVYATDAAASAKVRLVGMFPAETHPPITYWAAVVAGHRQLGRARPVDDDKYLLPAVFEAGH